MMIMAGKQSHDGHKNIPQSKVDKNDTTIKLLCTWELAAVVIAIAGFT